MKRTVMFTSHNIIMRFNLEPRGQRATIMLFKINYRRSVNLVKLNFENTSVETLELLLLLLLLSYCGDIIMVY